MSGKGFWNRIGLPSAADFRELQQLCHAQEQRISDVEATNRQLTETLRSIDLHLGALGEKLEGSQKQCADDISRSVKKQLQAYESNFFQKLDTIARLASTEQEKLMSVNENTYQLLTRSAKDQDELLRILIVNMLQGEVDQLLDQKGED